MQKYGRGYGLLLDRLSEETTRTGRARNRLFQIAQKAERRGDAAKAARIRRQNLGRRKLQVRRTRGEAAIRTLVGQAVRQALAGHPLVVVVEDPCPDPACGFVHKDNRHGDRFHCPHCGWDGDADVAAAMNLLARAHDPEIHLWTARARVKAILEERFRRRKETGNSTCEAG